MKNIILYFLLFALCPLLLVAQAPDTLWFQLYGEAEREGARELEQTSDGGYIIIGHTYSYSGGGLKCDLYLIKTDSLGDTLWIKVYGSDSVAEAGRSIDKTSDGGYIIAGTYNPGMTEEDIYLVRTDSLGDTLWTKTWGLPGGWQDFAYSVQQTTDGGYIMTGYGGIGPGGFFAPNIYLIKTDTNGNQEWFNTYDADTSWDMAFSVQQTTDLGYIVAGTISFLPYDSFDIYLIKTDSLGDTLWTRMYGGAANEHAEEVRLTPDGGYIIVGGTDSYGMGAFDVYLIKTDSLGDTLWTRTFGGSDDDYGCSVDNTNDGGYIIAGMTRSSGAGSSDIYVIKVDSLGDTLWTFVIGGVNYDEAFDVIQTTDGGYAIVGETGNFGANYADCYLMKLAPDTLGTEEVKVADIKNNSLWTTIFSGPLLLPEGKNCKIFDITGRVVVPDKIKPGIYFIEIDGLVTRKVVKIK